MKVTAFIVNSTMKALIVPVTNGDVSASLPKEALAIKESADRIRELDLEESCIGLDREAAKAGLEKDGFYINSAKMLFKEGK